MAAGVLIAGYVFALFCVREVPDRVIGLVGGPADRVEREGGVRISYRPAAGVTEEEIERAVDQNPALRREGDLLAFDLMQVSLAAALPVAKLLPPAEGGVLASKR